MRHTGFNLFCRVRFPYCGAMLGMSIFLFVSKSWVYADDGGTADLRNSSSGGDVVDLRSQPPTTQHVELWEPTDPEARKKLDYLRAHAADIVWNDIYLKSAATVGGLFSDPFGIATSLIDAARAAVKAYDGALAEKGRWAATQAGLAAFVAHLGADVIVDGIEIPPPLADPVSSTIEDQIEKGLDHLPQGGQ